MDERRRYGIEIEAGNVDRNVLARELRAAGIDCTVEFYNHQTRSTWKLVTDASIRLHAAFELVSPPLKGQDGLRQIRTVCGVLAALGAEVNSSCGLHVHHEAKDLKGHHLQRLVKLYYKAEPQIDTLMPRSRRGDMNTYCTAARWDRDDQRGSRYYKLNLHSLELHGTVEFRHHSGTVEADKIINWVLFTQRIVARCKRSINEQSRHRLTWFDVKQLFGLTRKDEESKSLSSYYDMRRAHFGY